MFVVQDDTGEVENANAYISVAYFRSYHSDRGTDTSEWEDAAVQSAIIVATDYADNKNSYKGVAVAENQTTVFPTSCFVGIPSNLKKAIAEYTLLQLKAVDANSSLAPNPDINQDGRSISEESEKIGPIETTVKYAVGAPVLFKEYPFADRLLLQFKSSGALFSVYRG